MRRKCSQCSRLEQSCLFLIHGASKKVIFVHGCFWHWHDACREGRLPKSRSEYWVPKLTRNRERDAQHLAALAEAGWRVLVIWECEIAPGVDLKQRLREFMEGL